MNLISDKAIFPSFQLRMRLLRQMNFSFTWNFFYCLAMTPQWWDLPRQ